MRFLLAIALISALAACQGRTRADGSVQGTPTPGALDRKTPVAVIDGQTVTAGEVDDELKGQLIGAQNEYLEKVHELRRGGLEELVNRRLLEKKAKAENITSEKLLAREADAKVSVPDEAELKSMYDQAVASGRQLPPFEEIKGQIADYIRGQKVEQARREYLARLRAEAKVEMKLPPLLLPRVDIEVKGPSKGAADAPVTIVEFSDFQCPYCGRAEPTVRRILDEYKGKVRLVYRDFPLSFHQNAQKASEAALCARDQGKYWEMHEKLFASQSALEVEKLKAYARELQLKGEDFDKCLESGAKVGEIDASLKAGTAAGVTGTPAFFINGRPLAPGAQPFERFQEVIEAELKAAKK